MISGKDSNEVRDIDWKYQKSGKRVLISGGVIMVLFVFIFSYFIAHVY